MKRKWNSTINLLNFSEAGTDVMFHPALLAMINNSLIQSPTLTFTKLHQDVEQESLFPNYQVTL